MTVLAESIECDVRQVIITRSLYAAVHVCVLRIVAGISCVMVDVMCRPNIATVSAMCRMQFGKLALVGRGVICRWRKRKIWRSDWKACRAASRTGLASLRLPAKVVLATLSADCWLTVT